MLSQALEGRARTHPGGPASASLALSRRMKQALRRRSSPPGDRAPPVWDKVKEASSPVLPLLRGADVSPGSRHHQDVTAGSPGGARRTCLPVPGAVLAPEMPNTSSPMLEPLRKGAGGLRDGRGPHFPASGASEVISQVLGVGSCASLCAGESLVRKVERGPLGVICSVVRRDGRGLHPLFRGLSSRCRGQRALVARVSGTAFPTVARPVENESMAEGSPAKHQFVHFKELLFFQSEET